MLSIINQVIEKTVRRERTLLIRYFILSMQLCLQCVYVIGMTKYRHGTADRGVKLIIGIWFSHSAYAFILLILIAFLSSPVN